MDAINHCLGCSTYEEPGEFFDCGYSKYNTNGSCPCCKCIVKMICIDDCKEYRDWWKSKLRYKEKLKKVSKG